LKNKTEMKKSVGHAFAQTTLPDCAAVLFNAVQIVLGGRGSVVGCGECRCASGGPPTLSRGVRSGVRCTLCWKLA
jgi:hypothetical protein